MPRTTFIVCTHNNLDIIDQVLGSIEKQTDPDWQAVCVDDASTDGTPERIASRHPKIEVLRRERGMGPSINRNEAIRQTESPFIACLDSDVELDPEWLARAAEYLEAHPDVGIVGGKLIYAANPTLVNSYGGEIGRIGIAWDGRDGEPAEKVVEPVDCLWVCSAAMLARRSVLEEIGLFDDTYFYGYEDSDIGWRVVLAGYRCVCIPGVIAYHRARTTIGGMGERITFHYHKNRVRSMLKNWGWARLLVDFPLYLAYSGVDLLARGPRRAKLRAWGWQIAHLPQTLRLRANIQRTRRKSDREIAPLFSRRLFPPTPLAERQKFRIPGAVTPGAAAT